MCLPVGFLKAYNGYLGTIVSIGVGLFGIIYSLMLIIHDKGKMLPQYTISTHVCWGFFGSSLIIFIFSILGLIGILKRKNILLFLYNIILIFAIIVFFGIGIASSITPFKIMKESCSLPLAQQAPWSQALQNLAISANTTFCQQNCPCYINNKTFQTYSAPYKQNMFAYLPYMNLNNSKFAQQYNQCPGYNFDDQQNYNILQQIQEEFECAGWCNQTITYYFYPNQNFNGVPQQSCYQALSDYYNLWGKHLLVSTWIVFAIIFANGFLVLCYICHPQKRASSMYQRLSG